MTMSVFDLRQVENVCAEVRKLCGVQLERDGPGWGMHSGCRVVVNRPSQRAHNNQQQSVVLHVLHKQGGCTDGGYLAQP